jgi:DNA-binding HxlR family transcriptional regulator
MTPEELDESLISLFNKGLINVEYDENLEPRFSVTPLGKSVVDAVDKLGGF